MNEEEVKRTLVKYFEKRKASGRGRWELYNPPTKERNQTGWDLAFRRPNLILFIEAKGIKGAFDGAFIASIGAVLMRRGTDVITTRGAQPWSVGYCIAFNTDRKNQYDLIRALFYKLTRPHALTNWDLLEKAGAKYLYLVRDDKKVLELKWKQVGKITKEYEKALKTEKISLETSNSPVQLEIIHKLFDNKKWV